MPDFRRAAKAVIRRALGQTVVSQEPALDVHDGLMHEHAPREARLIERTLRNGIVHPDVLHSFRHGEVPRAGQVPIDAITGTRQHVPLGERRRRGNMDINDLAPLVHAVHYNEDLEFPTHLNTRTREFTPKHADHNFMQIIDTGAT